MPSSQASSNPAQDQATILRKLTLAGWRHTVRGDVFNTANIEFQNETMRLEVDYRASDRSIYFSVYESFGKGIDLIIYFGDYLELLLDTIISFQSIISPQNYRMHIGEILQICPSTYVDSDTEVIRLIDSKNDVEGWLNETPSDMNLNGTPWQA